MGMQTITLKIQDIEAFKELVEALAQWANEVDGKAERTKAEDALYHAAVEVAEGASRTAT